MVKKIRRIRMTTRTGKLVVIQNTSSSTAGITADVHDAHSGICPTCGQPLLPATVELTPLLQSPPASAAIVCSNEHETDDT